MTAIFIGAANAYEHDFGNSKAVLSGYGTLGNLSKSGESAPRLLFDWQARGEYSKSYGGAVLTLNQVSELESRYLQDLFAFFDLGFGRLEIGHTNSAAQKLSVGLPDAGGLRINNSFIPYSLQNSPNAIATPAANSSSNQIRAQIVSKPDVFQAGFGAAAPSFDMDGSLDLGMRVKSGTAVKFAASLGASHIFNPDGLIAEIYAPRVYADNRSEIALGLNIQYHSWSLGAVGKAIYDANPTGRPSDGVMYGGGLSYEILTWRVSANSLRSDTSVFHDCDSGCKNTVAVLSVQDKLDDIVDIWASAGEIFSDSNAFFWSVSLRAKF
jgi:hypothetical protein